MAITLTKRAAEEVKRIMEAQQLDPKTFVRTVIVGGGCSGMQYTLGFDTEFNPAIDAKYETDGVFVLRESIADLEDLLEAYREGVLTEKGA